MTSVLRGRPALLASVAAAIVLVWSFAAPPAHAEVFQGGCTGSATFEKANVTVTEQQPVAEPVTILPEDSVRYEGSTGQPETNAPAPFEGGITVALPLGNWTFVTWGGESTRTSADGNYAYTLPGFVPRGTGPVEVTATHTQGGQTCVVAASFAVEGSPGPLGVGAAAGTALFAAGTLAAGMKKRGVA